MKHSIRDAAKKGQTDVCKILAKEVVQSRKAVSKLYASKAHMNSVMMQMQNQLCKWFSPFVSIIDDLFLATIRMAGAISKSTEVMHSMQNLVKLPEIRQAMMDLSREMNKVHTHTNKSLIKMLYSIFINNSNNYIQSISVT